ncbi:Uncharacterised conserved protein (DUF2228) [Nesidiocoris tenuis]|uniref:Uncharacterized conserved protein (DUF2228) n=1 Tax=Nesidiocoris tenuis TaxID=355587 RepID=A0ABN7AS19_9HEMI|nr:Uncharacterised conserved protein (DUF2228) [Nesidiocoris tenuis]
MSMSSDEGTKVDCKYGAECYQKNPAHLKKYNHPKKRERTRESEPPQKRSKNGDDKEPVEEKDNQTTDRSDTSPSKATDCDAKPIADDTESVANSEKELIVMAELPDDPAARIKALFLVGMPEDFFEFYKFCSQLQKKPAKKALAAIGLELVGPFDVLDGSVKDCTQEEALRHYRYFYDPPEFQTVLKGDDKSGLHYGYFRDDPKDQPCFVACNSVEDGCKINVVAANLFGALSYHIDKCLKTADPFRKMQIQRVQTDLNKYTKKQNISLSYLTPEMRARRSKCVSKGWHGAGVVVPYDKKTDVGYRDIIENRATLQKLFESLEKAEGVEETAIWSKLTPYLTAANISNDECDFGGSLEFGLAMFCSGVAKLHTSVLQVLPTSYELLNRPQYGQIIRAHLANRVKGSSVSTIC